MLKKVGVYITSEQFSVSDELFNAFLRAGDDDFEDEDEESLFAALDCVSEGKPNADFPAEERDDDGTIEIFTEGSLRIADGAVTLTYTETDAENNGTLKTTLRFYENEPESVNMIHFGEVNTSFLFEPHKRTKCVYNLPFGAMELTIRTTRVDNRLVEDGTLVLDYYLEIRGANAEHKRVTINLRT